MALIIEDGTGKPDAQSLGTVAGFRLYAVARGVTLPASDAACEVFLVLGMDRMEYEGDNYKGTKTTQTQAKTTQTQALQFPRTGMEIEGWPIDPNVIPRQAEYCQYAFAIEASKGVILLPTAQVGEKGAVILEEVAGIKRAYANPGRVLQVAAVAAADTLLRTLLRRSGLQLFGKVTRGGG
jgi:hypothetical protein